MLLICIFIFGKLIVFIVPNSVFKVTPKFVVIIQNVFYEMKSFYISVLFFLNVSSDNKVFKHVRFIALEFFVIHFN